MTPTAGQDSPPVLPNGEAGKQVDGATHLAAAALSPARTLRRLFLTLFLRGRSSRGLQKDAAPKSVGSKLGLTLAFYALFGLFALFFQLGHNTPGTPQRRTASRPAPENLFPA